MGTLSNSLKGTFLKFGLIILILSGLAGNANAATYDWLGGTSTDITNSNNWWNSSTLANGVPGSADDVNIAVNATYTYWIIPVLLQGSANINITYLPIVTATTTWKSLTFGYRGPTSAYTYGVKESISLTVNSGFTLTVTGNVTQNHNPSANGSNANYLATTIAGAGTLLCQGNFVVGDATTQPANNVADVSQVSIQITQLTITGNLVLNSNGNNGNGLCYPWFSVEKGTTTLLKQIIFAKNNAPAVGAFDADNPPLTTYPGYGKFTADNTVSSPSTVELQYKQPLTLADNFYVYFTYGGNNGTVLYDDPNAENQTIYTSNEPSVTTSTTYINTTSPPYYNVTFSGASTKVVDANSTVGSSTQGLVIGGAWTTSGGTVNLNTNNPTVTVTGNWSNSANVTQGSGNISIGNNLQQASNTITLGSGSLTVTNAMQINGGTVAAAGGTVTVNGAFQNNSGTMQCGSGSVIFKGNYTNSKTFTAGTGTVYFSGASQALLDNSTTGTTFNKVTFNASGTATMGAGTANFAVSNTGILTMVSPAKLVAGTTTAAYLTLNSAAASSATVAAMSGTSTITGNVNVQRYINGGSSTYRAYRLLSSPVYASTVNSNNVYSINYLKNSIYLTGTSTTGGMDNTVVANPTLYLFRENMTPLYTTFLNSNFKGINNINASPSYGMDDAANPTVNIPVGNGFLCFFRGNRASAVYTAETVKTYVPQAATLSTSGTLNQGPVTVANWFTPTSSFLSFTSASPSTVKGLNLVGNPYASSINWDQFSNSVTTANIYGPSVTGTIYVLDPVSHNYGAYIAGTGGVGSNNASNIIASGLGFFVTVTSTSAKLTFNEGAKFNTQPTGAGLLLSTPVTLAAVQYLRLQLNMDSVNTDNILIRFDNNAGTAYDKSVDAPYLSGFGQVSLSSFSSDKVALAINMQPFPKPGTTIPLKVGIPSDGVYSLNMKELVNVPQLFDIWLMDAYKKDSLDMRHNATYSFNALKSDTNSYGSNRFSLVIRQNPAYAYRLLSFTAAKATNLAQVQVAWKTENEQNYTNFTVERSTDNGKTFDVIGSVTSTGAGTYSFFDKTPFAGQNLYRLEQQDINGVFTYSNVVPVLYSNTGNNIVTANISLYPNPAITTINLAITAKSQEPAFYNVMISNSSGIVVKQATISASTWQSGIGNLLPGTYLVQVVNNKDKSLVGQLKFVKL